MLGRVASQRAALSIGRPTATAVNGSSAPAVAIRLHRMPETPVEPNVFPTGASEPKPIGHVSSVDAGKPCVILALTAKTVYLRASLLHTAGAIRADSGIH